MDKFLGSPRIDTSKQSIRKGSGSNMKEQVKTSVKDAVIAFGRKVAQPQRGEQQNTSKDNQRQRSSMKGGWGNNVSNFIKEQKTGSTTTSISPQKTINLNTSKRSNDFNLSTSTMGQRQGSKNSINSGAAIGTQARNSGQASGPFQNRTGQSRPSMYKKAPGAGLSQQKARISTAGSNKTGPVKAAQDKSKGTRQSFNSNKFEANQQLVKQTNKRSTMYQRGPDFNDMLLDATTIMNPKGPQGEDHSTMIFDESFNSAMTATPRMEKKSEYSQMLSSVQGNGIFGIGSPYIPEFSAILYIYYTQKNFSCHKNNEIFQTILPGLQERTDVSHGFIQKQDILPFNSFYGLLPWAVTVPNEIEMGYVGFMDVLPLEGAKQQNTLFTGKAYLVKDQYLLTHKLCSEFKEQSVDYLAKRLQSVAILILTHEDYTLGNFTTTPEVKLLIQQVCRTFKLIPNGYEMDETATIQQEKGKLTWLIKSPDMDSKTYEVSVPTSIDQEERQCDSHLLETVERFKTLNNHKYVNPILEEIIEINTIEYLVQRYISVQEISQEGNFGEIIKIMCKDNNECEKFTQEKISIYFKQIVDIIKYVHQQGYLFKKISKTDFHLFRGYFKLTNVENLVRIDVTQPQYLNEFETVDQAILSNMKELHKIFREALEQISQSGLIPTDIKSEEYPSLVPALAAMEQSSQGSDKGMFGLQQFIVGLIQKVPKFYSNLKKQLIAEKKTKFALQIIQEELKPLQIQLKSKTNIAHQLDAKFSQYLSLLNEQLDLLIKIGKIEDAVKLIPECVKISNQLKDGIEVIDFFILHGMIKLELNAHKQSIDLLEKANRWVTAKKSYEIKNFQQQKYKIFKYLSKAYLGAQNFKKANECFAKVIDEFNKNRDCRDDVDIVFIKRDQGNLLLSEGKPEEAIRLYQQAQDKLQEYVQHHEQCDVKKINEYKNDLDDCIASAYYTQQNFEKAIEHYKNCLNNLDIKRNLKDIYIIEHSVVLNIGKCYMQMKNKDKALEYFRQVEKYARQASLTASDPQLMELLCATLSHIGILNSEDQKFEDALKAYLESSEIMISIHGENHFELTRTYGNLGVCYERKNDLENSLQYFLKALQIHINCSGEQVSTPQVCKLYEKITLIHAKRQDIEKAKEYAKKNFEAVQRLKGEEHEDTSKARNIMEEINKNKDCIIF